MIGLGSNMGDRAECLSRAIAILREEAGEIIAFSSVWETEPWGFDADDLFLNMVVVIETGLQPQQLMQLCRSAEGRLGRRRNTGRRYESRVIDIDILLWEDRVISLPGLEVPHPRLADRKFVLVPLNEIAPDAVHPETGQKVSELLAMCDDMSEVRLSKEKVQSAPLSAKL
jgi:2-amino-4-hydroxy-6-hydroxymethyldihydropteridine diphosphokinase